MKKISRFLFCLCFIFVLSSATTKSFAGNESYDDFVYFKNYDYNEYYSLTLNNDYREFSFNCKDCNESVFNYENGLSLEISRQNYSTNLLTLCDKSGNIRKFETLLLNMGDAPMIFHEIIGDIENGKIIMSIKMRDTLTYFLFKYDKNGLNEKEIIDTVDDNLSFSIVARNRVLDFKFLNKYEIIMVTIRDDSLTIGCETMLTIKIYDTISKKIVLNRSIIEVINLYNGKSLAQRGELGQYSSKESKRNYKRNVDTLEFYSFNPSVKKTFEAITFNDNRNYNVDYDDIVY